MLHHEQREAAEDDAHPERVGDEVRLEETIETRHRKADAGQHQAERDQNHPELPQAGQRLGRLIGICAFHYRLSGAAPSALPRIQLAALVGRHVRHRRVLAQLKRPDVRDDQPSIANRHLLGVSLHRPKTVGDDVEEIADLLLAQAILVIRRRLSQAALHDHALSVAQPSVAGRAVDVEARLAARHLLAPDRERELSHELPVHLPGVERIVGLQPSTRDRPGGRAA